MTSPPAGEIRIQPFYLVLGLTPAQHQAAEQMLDEVRDELATRPTLGDRVRIGLIEFGERAQIRLSLHDPLDPSLIIPPSTGAHDGGNSFAAALATVGEAIAADATTLTAAGFLVERPAAWLVTDRPPTDAPEKWRAAFSALTDTPGSPFLVPCGFGGVADEVLQPLVHPKVGGASVVAYSAADVSDIGSLFAAAVVETGSSPTTQSRLVLPREPQLAGTGRRVVAGTLGTD